MSISNYTGTADTFTWPHNPNTYDDTFDSNHTVTKIGYQRHHIVVSGGGVDPKTTILTGHMDGTDRFTDFRSMAKHFQETTKLKKLYFESDKFMVGVGRQVKKTHTGGRTNFIDYVATFESILGILLGNTEKTSGTNDGDVTTFVTEVTGTVTSGASDITITDNLGNQITIPAASLSTSDTFTYKLIEMVDSGSGIFVGEFQYVEINGTQIKTVQTTDGFGIPQIAAGANVSTITTANLTGATVKFRDGWSQ